MQRNFTNDDFERFLKENAEEFRMPPTEKVWAGISKHLREKRRRTGFATGAFLFFTSVLGYFLVQQTKEITPQIASPLADQTITEKHNQPASAASVPNQSFTADQTENTVANGDKTTDANTSFTKSTKVATNTNRLTVAFKAESNATTQPVENEPTESEALIADEAINEFQPTIVDSEPYGQTNVESKADIDQAMERHEDLLSIESVTNLFRLGKKSKFSMQVFFTPTISYRKLSENKTYMQSVSQNNLSPNYAALYNINSAVTHKPDMGVELGVAAKYLVAKNLKLKGGMQFNVNRYDIKAFTYTTELATIALNDGSRDHSVSNYRNFGGNKVDWLQNLYFQVSVPVGAEVILAANDKTSFGVASTLQPTYMLGDRAYMLSTDYKNYTEVPHLVRRWNLNTNLETFVTYSTGKMNWQVGPQVRYQLLSSFVKDYPVKENLFDFGLKIGVSLNNTKTENNQ